MRRFGDYVLGACRVAAHPRQAWTVAPPGDASEAEAVVHASLDDGLLSTSDPNATRVWFVSVLEKVSKAPEDLCSGASCQCGEMSGVGLVTANCTEAGIRELLDSRDEVDFAEEDGTFELDLPPQPSESSMASVASPLTWNLQRVALSNATTTGRGVRIWVVDTGLSPTHEDLKGRVKLVGYFKYGTFRSCWSNEDANCFDILGHGTHVAGTAAGTRFGIATDAQVLSIRVFETDGKASSIKIVGALNHIARNRQAGDVVNLSLGGNGESPAITAALKRLTSLGVHIVVAAGNQNEDACYGSLSRHKPIFVVGASDSDDEKAEFSNWGECLDMYAPGQMIVAADFRADTAYTGMSGTSMAAPHAVGVAALYLESNKSVSPEELYHFLKASATWGALSELRPGDPNRLLRIGAIKPEQSEQIISSGEVDSWDSGALGRGGLAALLLVVLGAGA
eukprot:CAMPEP_0176027146 /NCGR_PEP_ID=MMETSP0120_2-20121206/13309_1 /TAXON_ID=160619 /ORGANISM="Kryptoperidinium foliaceum, Strain CCMP 1326" /LENGTH=451 /DNA_ID=CAMNT_0017360351 /DNA_START=83 /DNA_END=1439 /DNA_ORIENTATION=-